MVATNFVGPALLTKLFLPLLDKTAKQGGDVRILNVSIPSSFPRFTLSVLFCVVLFAGTSVAKLKRNERAHLSLVVFGRSGNLRSTHRRPKRPSLHFSRRPQSTLLQEPFRNGWLSSSIRCVASSSLPPLSLSQSSSHPSPPSSRKLTHPFFSTSSYFSSQERPRSSSTSSRPISPTLSSPPSPPPLPQQLPTSQFSPSPSTQAGP